MLTPSLMSKSPFRISSKTNYHDLHHRVDMLGTVLTDIRLYSAKEDSNIERIMTGLDHLHSKIGVYRLTRSRPLTYVLQ